MSRSVCSAVSCACERERPLSRQIISGESSERRRLRNWVVLVPKIFGAASGIAFWCSEWKNMCCDRWPWVSVRSARDCSTASRAGSRNVPSHGCTSSRARTCGIGVAVQRREPGDVAGVVAQPAPDVAARDAQQRVQARLVVGQPVLHHPRLVRQPVRRRAGRRLGVQGLRLRLGHLRGRRSGTHQERDQDPEPPHGAKSTPAAGRLARGRRRTASPRSVWLYIAAAGW